MPLNQTNQTEFFEIELIIYIKMDLVLNNLPIFYVNNQFYFKEFILVCLV